jgi:hypothetical protein
LRYFEKVGSRKGGFVKFIQGAIATGNGYSLNIKRVGKYRGTSSYGGGK